MTAGLSAVVVGADRLGNIPDLLKGHNISITHHISGRDPSHQKKTLQLPSGTQLVILLTDFLGQAASHHDIARLPRRLLLHRQPCLLQPRQQAPTRSCSSARHSLMHRKKRAKRPMTPRTLPCVQTTAAGRSVPKAPTPPARHCASRTPRAKWCSWTKPHARWKCAASRA